MDLDDIPPKVNRPTVHLTLLLFRQHVIFSLLLASILLALLGGMPPTSGKHSRPLEGHILILFPRA
jgi:hypothetical protein